MQEKVSITVVWYGQKFPSFWSCFGITQYSLVMPNGDPWDRNFCPYLTAMNDTYILAHQTRFSVIFTSADKSYLTYPYPTHGTDKRRIATCVVNTLVVLEVMYLCHQDIWNWHLCDVTYYANFQYGGCQRKGMWFVHGYPYVNIKRCWSKSMQEK